MNTSYGRPQSHKISWVHRFIFILKIRIEKSLGVHMDPKILRDRFTIKHNTICYIIGTIFIFYTGINTTNSTVSSIFNKFISLTHKPRQRRTLRTRMIALWRQRTSIELHLIDGGAGSMTWMNRISGNN